MLFIESEKYLYLWYSLWMVILNTLINTPRSNITMATEEHCVFCDIVSKNDPEIIIDQTDDLIIIKDIKPASDYHFLVISKRHIISAKYLTHEDKPLLENMIAKGHEIMKKNNADMDDARFGFHWPPFYSVPHLHLHCISPGRKMSLYNKLGFMSNSWWFVSPEYVLNRINKL